MGWHPPSTLLMKTIVTHWEPEPGWLLLMPSRLPDKQGDIILPESYTKKNNSGICFAPINDNPYLGKECLFVQHQEYQVLDSDTGKLFYILEQNKVILTRDPPLDIDRASWGEGQDGFQAATITRSMM